MLHHILESFTAEGFNRFMISVNYKSKVIKDYFKDGSQLGVKLNI